MMRYSPQWYLAVVQWMTDHQRWLRHLPTCAADSLTAAGCNCGLRDRIAIPAVEAKEDPR